MLSQSWFSKSKEGKMSAIDRRSRRRVPLIRDSSRDAVRSANVTKAVFQNSSIVGCSETKENSASASVGTAARRQVDPPASRQMERHMRNHLQVDQ